jgi:hypothetical protein
MVVGKGDGWMISYWGEDQLVVGDQLMAEGTANGVRISWWWESQLIMGGSADGGRTPLK